MTKKIAIGFFILLTTGCLFNANAQQDSARFKQRKGFIGFTIGPSFPSRMKAEQGYIPGNEYGLALDLIDCGYYFNKRIAVAVKYEGGVYPMSNHYLSGNVSSPYPVFVEEDKWYYEALFVGIRYASQGQRATPSLGLFAGRMDAETPTFLLSQDSTGTGGYKKIKGKSSKIALDVDFGINSHLGKRVDLLIRASFLYAMPEYNFENSSTQSWYYAQSFKQKTIIIKLMLGIAYRFL